MTTTTPTPVKPPDYLYHATHLGKIDDIVASERLTLGGQSQFSGGYDFHTRNRVFFTEYDGLRFWMNRMNLLGQHNSDYDSEDEAIYWTPVALRIMADAVYDEGVDFYPDALGTRDAGGNDSYYADKPIEIDYIEIWNGKGWVELVDADTERMGRRVIAAAEWEANDQSDSDEDGENGGENRGWEDDPKGYWVIDSDLFEPDHP